MIIRMFHVKHGYTHAYTPEQRKELETNGWEAETPQEKPKAKPGPKPRNKVAE